MGEAMDGTTALGFAVGGIALSVTATIVGVGAAVDWFLRRG